jgi:hypothetical protein
VEAVGGKVAQVQVEVGLHVDHPGDQPREPREHPVEPRDLAAHDEAQRLGQQGEAAERREARDDDRADAEACPENRHQPDHACEPEEERHTVFGIIGAQNEKCHVIGAGRFPREIVEGGGHRCPRAGDETPVNAMFPGELCHDAARHAFVEMVDTDPGGRAVPNNQEPQRGTFTRGARSGSGDFGQCERCAGEAEPLPDDDRQGHHAEGDIDGHFHTFDVVWRQSAFELFQDVDGSMTRR